MADQLGEDGLDADLQGDPRPTSAAIAPLFLLSFRHRDELSSLIERAGWKPVAARRAEAVEHRFLASGASVAVIDARGAFDEGVSAAHILCDPVEANAAALLILVSRNDVDHLAKAYAAGATHYLASPFSEIELVSAVRFAERHAERMGGGKRAARSRAVLLAAEDQSWKWAPGSSLIDVSEALAERLGTGRTVSARSVLRRLDGEGRIAAIQALRRIRASGGATAFAHVSGAPAGHRIAQHLSADPSDGHIAGRVEDLEVNRILRSDRKDGLTGLADPPGVRRWIESELARSETCVLILLSISRFEMVNAAFGHGTGDVMLRAVARRIERLLLGLPLTRHVLGRTAGAEYAVALSGLADPDQAHFIAEEMAQEISRPFASDDTMVRLSCRVGLTTSEPGERDGGAMLRRASAALADAKVGDGGRVVRSLDSSEEKATVRRATLEVDLRRALDQNEVDILFQPQFAIAGGRMIGVEALARWRHPEFGDLGAIPLFSAAERSDYLVPLSDYLHRRTLDIVDANEVFFAGLKISINVMASDISRPYFLEHFLELLDARRVERSQVTLEITESGLIEDLGRAAILLAQFRAAGLRVAIDDFGTGYSSLAYLKALPLDYLKIDPKLAQDIGGSPRDRIVVRGVIEMARSLGLTVVAEGIETEEQLTLLAEAGVNIGQGFLYAPPLSLEQLAKMRDIPSATAAR